MASKKSASNYEIISNIFNCDDDEQKCKSNMSLKEIKTIPTPDFQFFFTQKCGVPPAESTKLCKPGTHKKTLCEKWSSYKKMNGIIDKSLIKSTAAPSIPPPPSSSQPRPVVPSSISSGQKNPMVENPPSNIPPVNLPISNLFKNPMIPDVSKQENNEAVDLEKAGSMKVDPKRVGSGAIDHKRAGSGAIDPKRAGSGAIDPKRAGSGAIEVSLDFLQNVKLNTEDLEIQKKFKKIQKKMKKLAMKIKNKNMPNLSFNVPASSVLTSSVAKYKTLTSTTPARTPSPERAPSLVHAPSIARAPSPERAPSLARTPSPLKYNTKEVGSPVVSDSPVFEYKKEKESEPKISPFLSRKSTPKEESEEGSEASTKVESEEGSDEGSEVSEDESEEGSDEGSEASTKEESEEGSEVSEDESEERKQQLEKELNAYKNELFSVLKKIYKQPREKMMIDTIVRVFDINTFDDKSTDHILEKIEHCVYLIKLYKDNDYEILSYNEFLYEMEKQKTKFDKSKIAINKILENYSNLPMLDIETNKNYIEVAEQELLLNLNRLYDLLKTNNFLIEEHIDIKELDDYKTLKIINERTSAQLNNLNSEVQASLSKIAEPVAAKSPVRSPKNNKKEPRVSPSIIRQSAPSRPVSVENIEDIIQDISMEDDGDEIKKDILKCLNV